MPESLSFAVKHLYSAHKSDITLPVLLGYRDSRFETEAKVDPGSEVCLFSHEIGVKLAIPVFDGLPKTLDSLGGPLEAFGHEVTLQTCGYNFTSFAYFAKYPGLRRNLLGRQGWLRRLRIAIVDYDNLLYLSHYDD
jgi:hypothetical protein